MTMSSSLAELSYVKRREVKLNVLTTSLHPQGEIKQKKVYWRIFLLWLPTSLAKCTKVKFSIICPHLFSNQTKHNVYASITNELVKQLRAKGQA
jgi:hypothetical protein